MSLCAPIGNVEVRHHPGANTHHHPPPLPLLFTPDSDECRCPSSNRHGQFVFSRDDRRAELSETVSFAMGGSEQRRSLCDPRETTGSAVFEPNEDSLRSSFRVRIPCQPSVRHVRSSQDGRGGIRTTRSPERGNRRPVLASADSALPLSHPSANFRWGETGFNPWTGRRCRSIRRTAGRRHGPTGRRRSRRCRSRRRRRRRPS